jgi:hypothetical protein
MSTYVILYKPNIIGEDWNIFSKILAFVDL